MKKQFHKNIIKSMIRQVEIFLWNKYSTSSKNVESYNR